MRIFQNTSIRHKQTLVIMLTSSVALLLACAAISIYEVTAFRNTMKQNLAALADIVDDNTVAALDFNDPKSAGETLSALQADPSIIGAWVYAKDGKVFAKYDRPNDNIIFTPPDILPNGTIFHGQRLVLCRPIVHKGETVGTLYLESDMSALTARLTRFAGIVGLVFILSLLIAFGLSIQLQRLVSGPILHLAQVALTVAQDKNYSLRAKKYSNDEIGQLVDGFNEMLAQIQQRDAALQSARGDLERRVEERTKELGESQSLYHSLVDQMPAGIFRKDAEGRYVFVNSSFCRLKNFAPEQILGKTPHEIEHRVWETWQSDLVTLAVNHHALIMQTGKRIEVEEKYPGVDGKMQYLHVVKSAVFGLDGKIIGTQGMLFDITGLKQAEESLRLLSSAVEQSKESILITDAQLDLPGPKIIFVNPAFTQMTGYTAAEAIGKTPRILQGPRTDRVVLDRLRQNLEHGETFAGEAVNYRKDGTEFDLEWQIAPLRDAGGKITHFVAIQRDITERKRLEAHLVQSQKMETVGKLAGGIAHEFNSILTAIIGQSELLLGDLPPENPLAKSAAEIRKAAERAAVLTRQLLAYGRKQILEPEILDLNAVVTGMENVLLHLMGRGVEVRFNPAAGLKSVKADVGQIEQVIVNISMNAAEAMPNGGKLTLETANVTLDAGYVKSFPELKAGEYVMLSISDTGAGMSAETMARLFEPFFTTKGVGKGTGLGLATCHGIIRQSGGHIAVYSELGRGTTFKIYLPQVGQEMKTAAQPRASPDLPRGTETILLVEDDPSLREMAGGLLERLGYTVLTSANGVEAMGLIHRQGTGHIDLVFTDVVMPHMSGNELADRIRALHPQTKILFTSAYTENAIVHQGVLNKDVALLQKPFTPSALANKLREVLDQRDVPKPVTA